MCPNLFYCPLIFIYFFLVFFLSFHGNVVTLTTREIRLALYGPDIYSRRQASCIPHIRAAREGENEQGKGAWRGRSGRGGGGGGGGRCEWFLYEPVVSFLDAVSTWVFLLPLISVFVLRPSCCLFLLLFSISPHSLLHQPTVITVFLSAVCSAWHSVWRMMAIPEGRTHSAPPPSPLNSILAPPLTTASTPLQWGQYNADEKKRRSPNFASLANEERGWHVHLSYYYITTTTSHYYFP